MREKKFTDSVQYTEEINAFSHTNFEYTQL